jgi:hypothetical protein
MFFPDSFPSGVLDLDNEIGGEKGEERNSTTSR